MVQYKRNEEITIDLSDFNKFYDIFTKEKDEQNFRRRETTVQA